MQSFKHMIARAVILPGLFLLAFSTAALADHLQTEVVEEDGQFKGKPRISNRVKADTALLGFNPCGAIVEAPHGRAIILESLLPQE